MINAYDRAKEAGAFQGYDDTARRTIYGYEENWGAEQNCDSIHIHLSRKLQLCPTETDLQQFRGPAENFV